MVPGEASQDGPKQEENKHRSDENAVAPRRREKSTFVSGGQGTRGPGGREEACEEDSGARKPLLLSWVPGPLKGASDGEVTKFLGWLFPRLCFWVVGGTSSSSALLLGVAREKTPHERVPEAWEGGSGARGQMLWGLGRRTPWVPSSWHAVPWRPEVPGPAGRGGRDLVAGVLPS